MTPRNLQGRMGEGKSGEISSVELIKGGFWGDCDFFFCFLVVIVVFFLC